MGASLEAAVVYLPILLLLWLAYAFRARRRSLRAVDVLTESKNAGFMQPASLHPVIDPARCLGCGACVDACPEKSVLGLVHGKAELTTPANCIGHGACKVACPFDATSLMKLPSLGSRARPFTIMMSRSRFLNP